jgi:hypothetical protein
MEELLPGTVLWVSRKDREEGRRGSKSKSKRGREEGLLIFSIIWRRREEL